MAWLLIFFGFLLGAAVEAPLMGAILGALVSLFVGQRRLALENEDLRRQLGELKALREAPAPAPERPKAQPRAADAPAARPATRTEPTPVVIRSSRFAAMMSTVATDDARPAAPTAAKPPFATTPSISGELGGPRSSEPAPPFAPLPATSADDLTPLAAPLPVPAGEPTPFAASIPVTPVDPSASLPAPGEHPFAAAVVTPVDPFVAGERPFAAAVVTPLDPFASRSPVDPSASPPITPVDPSAQPPDLTTRREPAPAERAPPRPVSDELRTWDRTPRQPPPPPEPDLITRMFAAARGWLLGGNPVLRVGVVVLFLGFAFLLRYASERGLVPIEARYAGVAAAAMTLLGLGWWLRARKPDYALILQGTGVATLYLTIFAAIRLHPLLPPKLGLALLIVVTLGLTVLAVVQNARGLAAVAAIGGFAAPILASTGSGNHVALFTYLAVLNAGLLGIAWFKAWRLLNTIGFFGTFGIGLAWGLRAYTPQLFASTEPFLALFFLMYVGIGLLFARRKLRDPADAPAERAALLQWSRRQADYVDGLIVFGPPTVGFGLQVALVAHLELGAAFSAAALGLFYMLLARVLAARGADRVLLLVESCLALGVVFGTLAIPLGLDARWTSAAWAIEGAGLYWLALRQGRPLARAFALAVQLGAAVAYLDGIEPGDANSLLRGAPLGAGMLALSLLFAHDRLRRTAAADLSPWETQWCPPLLAFTGLAFLDLIAPLCLREQGTAIAWATLGLVTLFVGLKIRSRSYLVAALLVQLLGGALFAADTDRAAGLVGGVLASGWRGLMTASWIGLTLIAGMVLAARHPWVRDDRRILVGFSVTLLIGLGLVNLAVLFVLPWATASAVWGGSGLVIVWIGLVLQQRSAFVFGMLLQALAGAVFLTAGPDLVIAEPGARPLAHVGFWTPAVLAVAAMIGAWRLRRAGMDDDPEALDPEAMTVLSHLVLVWAAGWWALTAACEVLRFVPPHLQPAALLLAAAGSAALWTVIAARARWQALGLLCLALTPAAAAVLATLDLRDILEVHVLADLGWLGWLGVLVVHLASLRRLAALLPAQAAGAAHVFGCWLVLGVLALELRFLLASLAGHDNAWSWLGWALVPSLYLLLVASSRALVWPFTAHPREYRAIAAAPVAALLVLWIWTANALGDGDATPLPYLPVINPLELGLLVAVFASARWSLAWLPRLGVPSAELMRPTIAAAGTTLFAMLTALVMRTAHHWGGLKWDIDVLLDSMLVQAGLSIAWTLVALGLMISGHLRARRVRWTVGAALIGAVVIKLFFVELGNSGGLARIVSFIAVGVLLLIVGYFAPRPPAGPATQDPGGPPA